jgi:phospholipid/cholesterol/gamma-HCH transport system permease protein
MDRAPPALALVAHEGRAVVRLSGSWTLGYLKGAPALPPVPGGEVIVDGGGLSALDTSGANRLLSGLRQAGVALDQVRLQAMPPAAAQVWALVAGHTAATPEPAAQRKRGLLYQTGAGTMHFWRHLAGMANFVGHVAGEWLGLFRRPGAFRFREFVAQLEAVFVNAIPISFAMIFLLGIVFAYLMGVQAQKFGANIFVVDGVALAVLREISPVIVAILIAGRSGAAMTAQLGTMKVNEEIDALAVLGLSPLAVLILPRIFALVLAMPLLVFAGDIAGLLGGMLVAKAQLGIEYTQFWDRLDSFLKMKTLLIGLGKAPVFAVFIGLIACRMGLAVTRDARSVGVNTTSTVVQSIVAVIILNALFAVVFSDIGF